MLNRKQAINPNLYITFLMKRFYMHVASIKKKKCFGSTSFWCGSGSADPLPGIVDPIKKIQTKSFFKR